MSHKPKGESFNVPNEKFVSPTKPPLKNSCLPSNGKAKVNNNTVYENVTIMSEDEYGYVFVALGDLTKLNCDYWLGPSGAGLDPKIQKDFPIKTARQYNVPCANGQSWQENGYMGALRTYHPWPADLPKPYSIVLSEGRGQTESYIREIERFIRVAAADAIVMGLGCTNGSGKVRKHVCPLISIPLLGTGSGGNYRKTGEMVKTLLPLLYSLCNELRIDVAIITIEEDVFKVVQSCRHAFLMEHVDGGYPGLVSNSSGKRQNMNESNLNPQRNSESTSDDNNTPLTSSSASTTSASNGSDAVDNDNEEGTNPSNVDLRRVLRSTISGRRYLSTELLEHVAHLAYQVSLGQLSLFVGAGASMGAGLPSWDDLITGVAHEIGLSAELLGEFECLDYYTKAAVLEKRISAINAEIDLENRVFESQSRRKGNSVGSEMDGRGYSGTIKGWETLSESTSPDKQTASSGDNTSPSFSKTPLERRKTKTLGKYISEMVTSSRYSLVHALLASLPVNEIITTNYDDLLEKALVLSGPFTTLPRTEDQNSSISRNRSKKWLLKMHGCVNRPEEIVLTKQDYIRYSDRFAALSGIVQSLLLTKHLLFVGFSLDDDNFIRIYDSVKKAKGTATPDEDSSLLNHMSREQYKIFGNSFSEKGYVKRMMDKYRNMNDWDELNGMELEGSEQAATKGKYCGTALLLQHSKWKEELWGDEINMAFFSNSKVDCSEVTHRLHACTTTSSSSTSTSSNPLLPPPPPLSTPPTVPNSSTPVRSAEAKFAVLARKQEIFLDLLSSQCIRTATSGKFLMNNRYTEALTAGELEMKTYLQRISSELVTLSLDAKKTGAYSNIMKTLNELGCKL